MYSLINNLIKWSEVWPLVIALAIFLLYRQRENTSLIVLLIVFSIPLHFMATYISLYTYRVPEPFNNNNILYNLLAFIKPVLAGLYLLKLKQLQQYKFLKFIYWGFIVFTILNFLFLESILTLSSSMVLAECAVLLIFTMTFFLDSIIDDEIPLSLSHPAYFFCIAIGLLESTNFFIYLFLFHVYDMNREFAILILNISSVAFIIYGLTIALGLFINRGNSRIFNFTRQHE
jgi:hypothetical protein